MTSWLKAVVRHPLAREVALAIAIAVVASLQGKRLR
jgi:hypothetical protein